MQVVSFPSPSSKLAGKDRFADIYSKLNDDFESKLKFREEEEDNKHNLDKSWLNQENQEEEEEEDEEEFSFAGVNAENSPISAEEAFEDGQIRPVYPLFNRNILFEPEEKSLRSPLKKLFVETEETTTATSSSTAAEEEETEPMGPFCSWSGKTVEEASPETCRKSNSTGFSKLWRFKDLVLRSNSDGKDAFVFLNNDKNHTPSSSPSSSAAAKLGGGKRLLEKVKSEKKRSAHEKLYMRNRAIREEGRRRSYLPYKHVGFFTNVNGLTRNVHPY
ncbi:unnamed protein product [Cochlearia groenlandica]